MEAIQFTEDDIVKHRNKFAAIDGRIFPKNGKGAKHRNGTCKKCGKPSGPYAACSSCREIGTVTRAIKQLVKEGRVERLTDGRGVKGGAKYRTIRPKPFKRESPKLGRNNPCPCNSGKKFKKCCHLKGGG